MMLTDGSLLLPSLQAILTHAAQTAKPPFQADIVVGYDVSDSKQSTSHSLIFISAQTPYKLIIDTKIMFHNMNKVHMSTMIHFKTTFIQCRDEKHIECIRGSQNDI